MSFFDNMKTVGLLLIIVGLINLIVAVGAIAIAGTHDFEEGRVRLGWVVVAISTVIFGVLILMFGMKTRSGPNDKVAFVSGLIRVLGLATILGAIFSAVGLYLIEDGIGTAIGTFILLIIIGLIYLWAAAKVAGKSKNVISKVLWVILLIISLLAVLGNLMDFAYNISSDLWILMNAICSLCMCIVYIFVFVALLSPDVKNSMGI